MSIHTAQDKRPRLTAHEEWALARKIQAGLKSERSRKPNAATIATGVAARHELIERHILLVCGLAFPFYRRTGIPVDDLNSEGMIALERAARQFDPAKKVRFTTYATWAVNRQLVRFCAEWRLIRIPEPVARAMAQPRERWMQGVSDNTVNAARRLGRLETIAPEHDRFNEPMAAVVDALDLIDRREIAERAMRCIDARWRHVLRLRYGLDGGRPHTLLEVGDMLGITRERVRQIEAKALAAIRRRLGKVA